MQHTQAHTFVNPYRGFDANFKYLDSKSETLLTNSFNIISLIYIFI